MSNSKSLIFVVELVIGNFLTLGLHFSDGDGSSKDFQVIYFFERNFRIFSEKESKVILTIKI